METPENRLRVPQGMLLCFGAPQEELARPLVCARLEGLEAMKRRHSDNKALQKQLSNILCRALFPLQRCLIACSHSLPL